MNNIFNFNRWFIGVVENRNDPEKLGRCQVRIFGYHTESKELLPTEDLPWAIPLQPITSAGISGIGTAPLGAVEGSWVVGVFLDGDDMQQPLMMGTIASTVGDRIFTSTEENSEYRNSNDGILKDSSGEPIVDSNGIPIRVAVPKVDGWELGQTSAIYESGGRGPGTINNYNASSFGDFGGASYGTYQFASYLPTRMGNGKARPNPNNSPLVRYVKASRFRNELESLIPATTEFDNKWIDIARRHSKEFSKDQHDFIKRKYYDVYVSNLQRAGLDMTTFGIAVQDLIWSSAVQLGPGATSVFTVPLRGKSELTDTDIVSIVSDYKIANINTLFKSSSSSVRSSVRSRYESEKRALLNLIT